MSKRSSLGRGLESLIQVDPAIVEQSTDAGTRLISVTAIRPNPHQPRTSMHDDSLAELAASIRVHGLIQPLIVAEQSDGFTLIAGERRWRAAELAGLSHVPVLIKDSTPQEMLELALIENIQRADLNSLEEAHAYQALIDEFGLTQDEVAGRVGKARSTVANLIRLLNLPSRIQQAVLDGRISGAHARALLPLPSEDLQINAMNQIVRRSLSVRQTENLVKRIVDQERPKSKTPNSLSPELAAIQSEFEESLGTRVNIETGRKGGRVVIHYYSDEELQTIYNTIIGEA